MKVILAALICLVLPACATGERHPLVFEAHELHESLEALPVDDVPLHVPRDVLADNPQLSSEPEFVAAVTRGSSQGRLQDEGIRTALYAVYRGDSVLGIYGLEARSAADAERLEGLLREIWTVNASLERARVHRGGQILAVVWNAPETPSCWEAVNAAVAQRLEP